MMEIQYRCCQPMMEGTSIIGRALTGSGKTYAFLVPIVENFRKGIWENNGRPKAIILNPTRELVVQTANNAEILTGEHEQDKFKLKVIKLYGGVDWRMHEQELRRGCDIIISTTGRTIDLYNRRMLDLSDIRMIVFDEADRMLDMGFKDDIYKILAAIREHRQPQMCLFSATVNDYFFNVCKEFQIKYEMIDIVTGRANMPKKIRHIKMKCPNSNLHEMIADVCLVYAGKNSKCIIFCPKKQMVNDIIKINKIKAETGVLHGDIPQKQREITMDLFRQNKIMVLLTTDVMARGIDLPDLDLVIQVEPPQDVESYVHRSGRTGRMGREGTCITFYSQKSKYMVDKIEQFGKFKFEKQGPPQALDIMASVCRDSARNLDSIYNNINEEIIEVFKSYSDEIINKYEDKRKLVASLLCMVGGVDNSLNMSARSMISGTSHHKTFEIKVDEEIKAKGFLYKMLTNAMNAYNQTALDDKAINSVVISKNKNSFYFDVHEDYLPYYLPLFDEEGKFKFGYARKLNAVMRAVTNADQMEYDENEQKGYGGFGGGGYGGGGGGYGGGGYGGGQSNGGGGYGGGSSNPNTAGSKTVFVNGFDTNAYERDLFDQIYHMSLGETNKRAPKDRETRKLKGFMFLEFNESDQAVRAIDIINKSRSGFRARLAEEKR